MMSAKRQTLDQVLDSLPLKTVLQLIRFAQARQALYAVIQRLLQDRLAQLTSGPVTRNHDDELLTPKEAAKRLKLSAPRIYELVRQGHLPKINGLGTQVRIPASAIYKTPLEKPHIRGT